MTLEELRQLRQANPDAYRDRSGVKRVVVDNDKPSAPGVWQGGGTRVVEFPIVIAIGGPGGPDSGEI